MSEVIDIRSKAPFPVGALSNFAPHAFVFDQVACACMEALLQSLKVADVEEQARLCALPGPNAQRLGRKRTWHTAGKLWWRGQDFDRQSHAYQALLDRAYQALFDQSETFREALAATGHARLTHVFGKDDPLQTILTKDEFCSRLARLRASQTF